MHELENDTPIINVKVLDGKNFLTLSCRKNDPILSDTPKYIL